MITYFSKLTYFSKFREHVEKKYADIGTVRAYTSTIRRRNVNSGKILFESYYSLYRTESNVSTVSGWDTQVSTSNPRNEKLPSGFLTGNG